MHEDKAARLLGLLGLARRAGKLAMGFTAVEKMVTRGENPLVIVASDMGPSQKAKVARWQPVRGVIPDVLTSADMARSMGREKLAVVAVSDAGFIKGIRQLDN